MFILLSIRMVVLINKEGFLKNLTVMQNDLMDTVYVVGYLGMIAIIPLLFVKVVF